MRFYREFPMFPNTRDPSHAPPGKRRGDLAPRRTICLALAAAVLVGSCAMPGRRSNPLLLAPASSCSADPQAATSVPGWITVAGSPTFACAGSLRARWPRGVAPRVVIASGPWGTSALERVIALPAQPSAHYRLTLSAWFAACGPGRVRALLRAQFLGASGEILGRAIVLRGPRSAAGDQVPRFERRSAMQAMPRGAVALRLHLELGGSSGRAASYVAGMSAETSPPMSFPPASPPATHVPPFDHVFVVMMENTNFDQVIGDRKDAPYINSLAARGALLANYQAVYHPSDENYLAVAGGDVFVSGAAYFPNVHIAAPHLGDLLEAAGRSWRAYEEGMGTPCNTTTRYDKNYEPDDAPFILFDDIQRSPARCRAHLVGLREWPRDLEHTATTPAFVWLAADDYDDGELPGNGSPASLRVQDAWLRRTLAPLFESAAWRGQRSLLILTWDESDTMANNHIATIVLGSRGTVKSGYVSRVRYDHYSTARTIEAALGLPSMTGNDGYARAFDDVFVGR